MSDLIHTVVLVEEDETTRTFLADNLTADGFAVHPIDDPDDALRLCARTVPDAALVDVNALTAEEDLRLTVATIHSAKGTEAQVVFVIGCEERRLPSSHAIEGSDPLAVEEERRLFYVATTRA